MRVRRRRTTRRGRGATPPTLPPILPPPDLTTEIEQSVEARDKLEAGVARTNAERDQLKPAFLRAVASELRVVEIDADRALEKLAAWQAQEARAAQQSDALRQLSAMFKERIEQFKSNSRGEAVAALQRITERLMVERDGPGADKNAINKRIEKLLAEQESLRATMPPVPPREPSREPNDKSPPPQRPAKNKPPSRESGNR